MKLFRKAILLSSDKKKKEEMFMSVGSYSEDLKNVKKQLKGYSLVRLNKSFYDTYGDIVRSTKKQKKG